MTETVAETKNRDQEFMRLALVEARRAAAKGEVPVGALVVCDGEVVAAAHNLREMTADPAAHAEFLAIEEAAAKLERWRLSDCTIYVTLERCAMCAGLMVNCRIGCCVYGTSDPKAGACGTLFSLQADERLNHSFEVRSGVLKEECRALLQNFFRERRERRKK